MRRVIGRGFGRGNVDHEVDDELSFHIDMRTRKLLAQGKTPEEARREALRQFGDVEAVRRMIVTMDRERDSAMQRANFWGEVRQDLTYAARTLRTNLGVTAVVATTLALGIGANTSIFTLVNAVLLRELPVKHPEELVAIGNTTRTGSLGEDSNIRTDLLSYDVYRTLRERSPSFSGLLASGRASGIEVLSPGATGEPDRPRGRYVSGNYFSVLGVPALRGRTFDGTEDASIGGAPVVTISYGYWTRHFSQDPAVVGKEIVVNGARLTIIGVTPAWFTGEIVGQSTDIWLPLTMQPVLMPNRRYLDRQDIFWLLLLGRRAPGVTEAAAISAVTRTMRDIVRDKSTSAVPASQEIAVFVSSGAKGFSRVRNTFGPALITLMIGVGLLVLIICANVANLLLARAVARSREMSVRLALGAGRGRLVRQLLTESLLLAMLGAALGLLLARGGSRLLLAVLGDGGNAIPLDVGLDWAVLAFTFVLSLLTVVLFGLVPALRASGLNVATTLRASAKSVTGAQGASGSRVPIGRMLIAAQVALSLVLLVGAALLVRSLRSVEGVDTGLDRDHLLIAEIDPTAAGYSGERFRRLAESLADRLRRVPGVADVTYSENGIFSGTESSTTFQVPGFAARSPADTTANYDQVGPGYVRAVGARLLQGRDLTPNDGQSAAPVMLVNASMARFYFGTESPIGRTVAMGDTALQIVGVVADVKDHELRDAGTRRFYLAYQQAPAINMSLRMIVRATGDPALLAIPVRQAIQTQDALVPIASIEPLSELMRESVREDRLLARLATGFGILALLLAAVGLYGVMTYAIARRTSEIGLRVALGARRADVIGMVLGDALRLVALGIVVGVPLALASARLLRNQLYGVGPTDPASLVLSLLVLTLSAVLAALLPALRASRVAPLIALRQE